jgi:hypothetical protein
LHGVSPANRLYFNPPTSEFIENNTTIVYGLKEKVEPISYNNRIAVCTCIFRDYDTLKHIPENVPDNVDFFCFTDNPTIESGTKWNIDTTPYHLIDMELDIESTKSIKSKGDTNNWDDNAKYWNIISKYYKMCLHRIPKLKEYNYFIYIDGTLELKNFDFLNEYNSNYIMYRHPDRISIKEEGEEAIKFRRYQFQPINEQVSHYYENGFEKYDTKLQAAGFSYRPNSEIYNAMYSFWYYQVQKWSNCCQISAPYVQWLFNLIPAIIDEYIYGSWNTTVNMYESTYLYYKWHNVEH